MAPRLTPQQRALRAVTEREWQNQVVALAHTLGWDLTYHPYYSERSLPGWPDLVLVSVARRRTLFAELKTETGTLTAEQPTVLSTLAAAGNEVYLWRPSHLSEVTRILTTRTRPATTTTAWDPSSPVTNTHRLGRAPARSTLSRRGRAISAPFA